MQEWVTYLIVAGIVIFMLLLGFVISFILKQRRIRKAKNLYCEIYLKDGGRETLTRSIDENEFTHNENRYFIQKDFIQKEFIKKRNGLNLFKFIQFEEGIANPFIMGFLKAGNVRKFCDAKFIEQFMNTKIWEDVGGIGNSKMSTPLMIGLIIAGLVILGILFFVKK